MNAAAVGTALRVLGTAVTRELVLDTPRAVVVYARTLEPSEIAWLFRGMDAPQISRVNRGEQIVEDVQIVGTILGRVVRVLLLEETRQALLAELRIELAAAAVTA